MAILDHEMRLAKDQAVTASAATTNHYNLGSAKDVGISGKDLQLMITVTEAADASGAATVDMALQCDTASGFGTVKTMASTGPIGKASLTAGKKFYLKIPTGFDAQYVRGYFTVATGPLTAGKFTVDIVDSADVPKIYKDAN